ncbi:hypothetical protein [Pseudoblastomonas halimionae]|uniref:Uncharacterized protein n=1 Tax=Alteriqipengyuania halimionae TaxID=1926630 RepID=A0A6I4U4G2_9SPHN|nr:hypothetical protein [Alteriqipengyuania halimionae]MXP09803.1 hypothetical protein [Alteriqipengyuania halimionae]
MSGQKDPTKPTPNDEKFKPQNVADPQSTVEPPSRDADKPANSGGKDIPAGSQSAIGDKSRNRT